MTVLSQPAADRRDRAVRWRQLVDLVARAGANASSPAFADAIETIRADTPNVDENLRVAAARAIAALPLPFALLDYFASSGLAVSAPLLAAATLEPEQWRAILRSADDETRNFVATLHPDVVAEPIAATSTTAPDAELTDELIEAAGPGGEDAELTDEQVEARIGLIAQMVEAAPGGHGTPPAAPSLQEVVERIERRQRGRSVMRLGPLAPAAEPPSSLFRWECGPGGEIAWVDGAPRGALIGRSIARARNGEGDRIDREVVRAFTVRAPFRDGTLTIAGEGSVAGEWKISGVPAFDPADGRFRGYRGIALRNQDSLPAAEEQPDAFSDPNSLRELVHEIKTPLNAVMGFAEIIEGQYLGPAERPYRERATDIVAQARLLLLAIDDIDFTAKVHSSEVGDRVADLVAVVRASEKPLLEAADRQSVTLDVGSMPREAPVRIEAELAERLVLRLGIALIELAGSGERLRLTLERSGARVRVSMSRPAALAGLDHEQLVEQPGEHDNLFVLRLLRGVAAMAGVELDTSGSRISLLFPRA